jgi:hypothetical protein
MIGPSFMADYVSISFSTSTAFKAYLDQGLSSTPNDQETLQTT